MRGPRINVKHLKNARPVVSTQGTLATMTLNKGDGGLENRKESRDGGRPPKEG